MREKTSEKNSPKIVLKARPSPLHFPFPSELKRAQPALIENMEQKAAFYKSAKVSICFPTKTDCTVHTQTVLQHFSFTSNLSSMQNS